MISPTPAPAVKHLASHRRPRLPQSCAGWASAHPRRLALRLHPPHSFALSRAPLRAAPVQVARPTGRGRRDDPPLPRPRTALPCRSNTPCQTRRGSWKDASTKIDILSGALPPAGCVAPCSPGATRSLARCQWRRRVVPPSARLGQTDSRETVLPHACAAVGQHARKCGGLPPCEGTCPILCGALTSG